MTEPPVPVAPDVIVVGAGPVGLTTALLLAAGGVRTTLLERNDGPSSSPKAISLDDSSMRTFQRAGLDHEITSIIVPGTGTAYFDAHGSLLFHARGPEGAPLGHPFKNPFAQPELEATLFSQARTYPQLTVALGADVRGISQDASAVEVTFRQGGHERRIAAPYLVAADGGQSTVRRTLGISMTGRSFDESWLVVDTLADAHDERFGMHHGDPARPLVIVPGLAGRCRYEFKLEPHEGSPGVDPGFELIARLLAPHRDISPAEVERAVVYRFHALVADHFSAGRIYLVGDAAHMMPPFAGQGLNSGVRDAANLAWKIADVVHGRMPQRVLDTYETERRPHVEATVWQSVLLGESVMTSSTEIATTRDSHIRSALQDEHRRRYLEHMSYRPSADLRQGLIFPTEPGDPTVGTTLAQPSCFSMAEHRVMRLDDVLGPGWSLLAVDPSSDQLQQALALTARIDARLVVVVTTDHNPRQLADEDVVVDFDGSLQRTFVRHTGHALVVRPDRVVASRWPLAQRHHGPRALDRLSRGEIALSSAAGPDVDLDCPIWATTARTTPSIEEGQDRA